MAISNPTELNKVISEDLGLGLWTLKIGGHVDIDAVPADMKNALSGGTGVALVFSATVEGEGYTIKDALKNAAVTVSVAVKFTKSVPGKYSLTVEGSVEVTRRRWLIDS